MTLRSESLSWAQWGQVGGFVGLWFAWFVYFGVVLVFTGTFERVLDEKSRIVLPKRLRTILEDDWELYLTPGSEGCLELHTNQSLNELADRVRTGSAGISNQRSFSRLFYARAVHCEVDKQGRIRVPSHLAELAEIGTSVCILGVGTHWEIWNQDTWSTYLENNFEAFDQITQETLDGRTDGVSTEPSARIGMPR